MSDPELTQADALVMADRCPLIRAAYASEDPAVIARVEASHPPKRCEYVKQARAEIQKQEADKEKARKAA